MRVYKLLTEDQWREVRSLDHWEGAPIDRADGFIHLSAPHQVVETATKHFRDKGPLVLLGFEGDLLSLKWEPSRGGQLFPHLYGPLPLNLFSTLHRIPVGEHGLDFSEVFPSSDGTSLAGVKVLDLSRILAGPSCTQLLADLGADVIKVERPGVGDDTRKWGPPFVKDGEGNPTDESTYYQCANRNKRSIEVDMGSPEGTALLKKLAASCDILVENFKTDGLQKYGLDYDTLRKTHPHLVYCSITGFGQTGPNRQLPGYDLLAQGYGGIMSLTGPVEGPPMKVGVAVCDLVTGLYASTAILAALRHRDRTGQGQQIDLALLDVQLSWLANAATQTLNTGRSPARRGNQHPSIVPYQPFPVADGWAIIAIGNDRQYRAFCTLIGHPEWADDPRFRNNARRLANRDLLIGLFTEVLATWERDELLARMEEAGVPGGPIHDVQEAFATEQARAREMVITMPHSAGGSVKLVGNPLKLSATPVVYRSAPPVCGEHTEEVMNELL